jgi:hypothetical protein
MSEKREKLKRQADFLYDEWNEARSNLELKASTSLKKVLVLVTVGYSLVYLYKLINSDSKEKKVNKNKPVRQQFFGKSRLTSALKALILPLIIKIVRRELIENDRSKNI